MYRMAKDMRAYAFSTGDGSTFPIMMELVDQQINLGTYTATTGIENDSILPKKEHLEQAAIMGDPLIDWNLSEPYSFDPSVGFGIGGTTSKTVLPEAVADVKVWPNPVSELLNISIMDETESEVVAELYDLQGRLLAHRSSGNDRLNGHHQFEIDVRTLPSGPVILKVNAGTHNISKVLSITH